MSQRENPIVGGVRKENKCVVVKWKISNNSIYQSVHGTDEAGRRTIDRMINGGGSSPAPDSNTLTEERRSLLAKTRMINSSKIRTQDGHSITYSAGVEMKYTPA